MRRPTTTALLRPKFAAAAAVMLMTALAWLLLAGHGLPAVHHHVHAQNLMAPSWGPAQWFAALFMWLAMTVAMMLPTAAPAILSVADGHPDANPRPTLRQTGAFVAGYLLVWWSFGLLATVLQWLLAITATQMGVDSGLGAILAGTLLALAGLYQFSALKRRCLAHCHGPVGYLRGHWHAGGTGAHQLGLRHGLHCLGCCWALMALMLLGGAMSIGWMAVLASLMLAEKLLPGGLYVARVAGVGLIGWGGLLLAGV